MTRAIPKERNPFFERAHKSFLDSQFAQEVLPHSDASSGKFIRKRNQYIDAARSNRSDAEYSSDDSESARSVRRLLSIAESDHEMSSMPGSAPERSDGAGGNEHAYQEILDRCRAAGVSAGDIAKIRRAFAALMASEPESAGVATKTEQFTEANEYVRLSKLARSAAPQR